MKCPSRWPCGNCALGQRPDQPPNSPGYAGWKALGLPTHTSASSLAFFCCFFAASIALENVDCE